MNDGVQGDQNDQARGNEPEIKADGRGPWITSGGRGPQQHGGAGAGESSWTASSTYRHPHEAPAVLSTPAGPRYAGYDHTGHARSTAHASSGTAAQHPRTPAGTESSVPNSEAASFAFAGLEGGSQEAPHNSRRGPGWPGVIAVSAAMTLVGSLLTASLVGGTDAPEAQPAEAPAAQQQADPVVTSTREQPDWRSVAAAVRPSVVAISVQTTQGGGEGSGIVYDDAGHVVTNDHVVAGAVAGGVQVTMADGEIIPAQIVGTDPATDLAVLQLEKTPQTLQPATMAQSSEVSVGDPVAALGNPLGLTSTMTTGIVSALDRPVMAQDPNSTGPGTQVVTNAIQVDAPVNPGNSGGALFDAAGRVIGVTSSIATTSSTGGSVGLGFAIPADLVENVVPQLIANGKAEHAYLGVSMVDGQATADGVTKSGAEVQRVEPGTPAAEAGIQAGDVLVAMDGKSVGGADALTGYVRAHATGDEVTLTYVRGGTSHEATVTLTTRPDNL